MRRLKAFRRDCKGNVAVMFGLALVPLTLAAGVAIDMVQTNRTLTVLQAASDAAAIAGATSGANTSAETKTTIQKYLKANGAEAVLDDIEEIVPVLNKPERTFSVRIKGKRNTSLMHLAGIDQTELSAHSEVKLGGDGLEVALVLDVTHSMNADGRLPALKVAATDFVETIMEAKKTGADVRVGIVPFAEYVNVGMGARNKPWMNVPPDSSVTLPEVCTIQYPERKWKDCDAVTKTGYNDGVPYTYTAYENCTVIDGPPKKVCTTPVKTTKWYGCVGSRNAPMDENISTPSSPYPGLPNTGCNGEIMPLTAKESKLKSKISGLTASGNTYIPAGLLWGWNMVDSNAPLDEAKTAAEIKAMGGMKAIVLMTDGDNTKSATYPWHWGNDGDKADKKVIELCKNIKKDQIVIYTISFMVKDAATVDLLQSCASDSGKAFAAEDAVQLSKAFGDIGNSMLSLRLSK